MPQALHTRLMTGLFCLALSLPALATEVASVRFDDKVTVAGTELQLNGAGLRKRLMFRVYAMGLYLPQKSGDAQTVLAGSGARRIHIVTLRELGADQFADALIEGLNKNLSPAEQQQLNPRIESFRKTLLSMGKAAEKTVVYLDFVPGSGTRLSINGETKGSDIPGEDFYAALLRIWLGREPAQEDLRAHLLGRPG